MAALGATAGARHVQTEGVAVFVQVIQGQVDDAGKVRAAMDRWAAELAPGADGWLGSTAGVTEDGRFIGLARFESEEAARRNSDRPEQDRWWAETSRLFRGEASFRDSSDVTLDLPGDPDQAGFVQVMQGRGTDPDRARELMADDSPAWAASRPDIIAAEERERLLARGRERAPLAAVPGGDPSRSHARCASSIASRQTPCIRRISARCTRH